MGYSGGMNAKRLSFAAFALLPLAAVCGAVLAAPPESPPATRAQLQSQQNVVAELALQRGDCRTAAENFAAASVGAPVAQARHATEVAFDCQQPQAAWTAAQSWLAAAPNDREAGIVYATAALRLYLVPEARTALAVVFKSAPPMSDADIVGLAQVLVEQSDVNAAFAALTGFADTPAASPAVLTLMGQLALQAYDFNRAQALVRQALQKEPQQPGALRLAARLAVLRGDAAAAIAGAHAVMKADPTEGAFELAEIYSDLNRPEDARKELERLRATGDISGDEIDRRLALLDIDAGALPAAQKRLVALLDRGEASDGLVFLLAQVTADLGDGKTALGLFRKLLDSAVAAEARAEAAGLLMEQDKRAEALSLLDEGADEGARSTFQLLVGKTNLLADHGDADGALALLAAGLQSYPRHPTLEYQQATLLERAGQTKDSVQAFEQLLTERPADPTVQNALGYTLADHGQQLPRAEDLVRKALAAMPDSPAALDSLGWVRLRRGEPREASGILQKAYSVGQDADIAAHLGEALWLSGSHPQALKVWNEARARHPDSPLLDSTIKRLSKSGKAQTQ